jgi:hypothetical protein
MKAPMRFRLPGVFAVALAYVFTLSVALGASALGAHAARAAMGADICQPQGAGGSSEHALCETVCQIAGAPMLASPAPASFSALGFQQFSTIVPEDARSVSDEAVEAAARGPPAA